MHIYKISQPSQRNKIQTPHIHVMVKIHQRKNPPSPKHMDNKPESKTDIRH
jgi:hypothetical protein